MEWQTFKTFVVNIKQEGNRLQKAGIDGNPVTKKRFTSTERLSIFLALVSLYLLPAGFMEKFSGYTITFLGIFVGMFSSAVIALNNKSSKLIVDENTSADQLVELRKARNLMVQFTGLSAYAMLLAIIIIILMLMNLAHEGFRMDIFNYTYVRKVNEINWYTIKCFVKFLVVIFHRFFTIYLFFNFFIIVIYAITSYFSFLLSEYENIKLKK